jgi:hypothetical protein
MTTRVVILGDSNIGGAADGAGSLARALMPILKAAKIEVVDTIGVGGSTMAQWLRAAGLREKGGYGRFSPRHKKALSSSAVKRADLVRIRNLAPDFYIINFASNDAASGINARTFVGNARQLVAFLGKPAIWLDGGLNNQVEAKKRPLISAWKAQAPRTVQVLDSTPAEVREPYLRAGARAHPPVRVHAAALAARRGELDGALARAAGQSKVGTVALIVGALIAAAAGFLIAGDSPIPLDLGWRPTWLA